MATLKSDAKILEILTSLSKQRGFVFQSSEIYGGLGSTWDYGPVGVELKRNIKNLESYNEIDDFINLNKEWAKTKGLSITDPEKEKEMLWKNHKNGIEKIFLAYKEKKLISGLRIGIFNKIAYTNFVINSYKDPTNLGGTLLTWNALEWAKNNDYHYFVEEPKIKKVRIKSYASYFTMNRKDSWTH